MYLSRRSLLRLRVWPWSLPEPQYILYVCDDTPTQPTSPHLLLAAVWTSAAAVLPQPATRNVCTRCTCASSTAPRNYLPTHHTLPRQSSLPTAVIVDRKSHCTHPPLCRSRECPSAFLFFLVNKMCTYSNTKLSGAVIRARRLWTSCGTRWETRMSLRLLERSGYRSSSGCQAKVPSCWR